MADRPEFSESTKRKLAVRWDTVRDNQNLTEEDLSHHDLERRHLLGIAAQPLPGVNPLRPKDAARSLGLDPSVRAAVARFREEDWEYWQHWCFSGAPYQTYAAWLDILKQDTLAELASIWKGKSAATDRWFQETCAPAIEQALAVLVKQRIAQARDVESKRLDRVPPSNPILNEINAAGDDPEAIRRLSPQAKEAIRRAQLMTGLPLVTEPPKLGDVAQLDVKAERARPGPKRDPEIAKRIREIVLRISGSEPWKSRLDDICEALDEEGIPLRKAWSKLIPPILNWVTAATSERERTLKALEYQLKIAKS